MQSSTLDQRQKDRGEFDEAIEIYKAAIQNNPINTDIWNNRGVALKQQERFEEAIELYKTAIEINLRDVRAFCNMEHALRRQDRVNEAIET